MKNKYFIRFCLGFFQIFVVSCSTNMENPTIYTYSHGLIQVRNALTDTVHGYFIEGFEDKDDVYTQGIFMDSSNVNDIVLIQMTAADSKVYSFFGRPFPYEVDFHVHFDSISENKTRVTINALNPKINFLGFGIGHLGFVWSKKVRTSTIEEYEILLMVGKKLNEVDMPACKYPQKYLKYEARKQRRIKKLYCSE